jgi:arsenite methyltransferase
MLRRKGEYGFDAPYVPALMALGALLLYGGAAIRAGHGDVGGMVSMGASGMFLAASAASYVYATRTGKFFAWDLVLDGLALRPSDAVLDLGCGRGAVLLLAAQRLSTGRATGVDLWQQQDQSGNSLSAAQRNAQAEGIGERVVLETADMRELPFSDATFDVVVSSLAIHNIPTAEGRARAVREAIRVLRPGGKIALADFRFTSDYAAEIAKAGFVDVVHRSLGPSFWYGGPWAATRLVTARKPQ